MKWLIVVLFLSGCGSDESQECSEPGQKSTAVSRECVFWSGSGENARCTQYQTYTNIYECGSDHKWHFTEKDPK